ncbi:LuxR C-terminal-related transcriptional regulator [Nocardia sp. NRRL S-836]|uniref:helix-turn-helix transcriptional regulator n=1 Tax=Nocardia sp. NRRL S-836 TaxID=1519492 RepID=UPI0006AF2A80|nr:LuxR C-terminal-related transcriptional regulator [Nocardia sp. NRRL S-836]
MERHDHLVAAPAAPPVMQETVDMTSFVGRSELLGTAKTLMTSARLVTLIGAGGVGKTRLLDRLARECANQTGTPHFKHGVAVARLGDIKSTDDRLDTTIAEALGILHNASSPIRTRLVEHLRHKQLLLLLDNCEQLVGDEPGTGPLPDLLRTLLSASPALRIVVTSQTKLGVRGEHLLPVPPLCTGVEESCDPAERGTVHEAQRLLLDRAQEIGVRIPRDHYALVSTLCELLGGLPLAIELAAGKLDIMTLQEMVEQHNLLHVLVGGSSEQRRHRTLRSTLDWSYNLLTPDEKHMFMLTSVFDGGFDLHAATAVAAAHDVDQADVLGRLATLVRKSLLLTEQRNGRTRYRMLPIIRHYGRELINESEHGQSLLQSHADYFEALLQRGADEWLSDAEVEWMRTLRADLANILTAQDYLARAPGQSGRARQMAINAKRTRFLHFAGLLNTADRMFVAAPADTDEAVSAQQVTALSLTAWIALTQGNPARAKTLLVRAEDAARELGISDSFPPLLLARGSWLFFAEPDAQRASEAVGVLQRAVALFHEAGSSGDVFMAQLFLTMATALLGEGAAAFHEVARLAKLVEGSSPEWSMSWVLWAGALADVLHGDPHAAFRSAQEALQIQRRIGDTWGPVWSVWLIAVIAATVGQSEHAGQLFGAANTLQGHSQTNILGMTSLLRVQDQAQRRCRLDLGDDDLEFPIALGESLPICEALDLAQREPLPRPRKQTGRQRPGGLSERQWHVAQLVAQGMTNHEIGEVLHISKRTAEVHVGKILSKLDFATRVEIATWVSSARPPVR